MTKSSTDSSVRKHKTKKAVGRSNGCSEEDTESCVCGVCGDAVQDDPPAGEESIFCEGNCQVWLHRKCAGLSSAAFAAISSSHPFSCLACQNYQLLGVVNELKSTVSALNSEVSTLQSRLSALTSEISVLQSQSPAVLAPTGATAHLASPPSEPVSSNHSPLVYNSGSSTPRNGPRSPIFTDGSKYNLVFFWGT